MDVNKIITELEMAIDHPHSINIFRKAADCIKALQAQLDEKNRKEKGVDEHD